MVALSSEALHPEPPARQLNIDWTLVVCILGALVAAGTAVAAYFAAALTAYLSVFDQHLIEYGVFALSIALPLWFCWRKAIADGQLPARRGLEPQYEHVSGWSALFLLAIMLIIAWLVWWASHSDANNHRIHAEWGTWTVVGLSIAFVVVAAAPVFPRIIRTLGLQDSVSSFSEWLNRPIDWLGRLLSGLDSLLVFMIANAVGANRDSFFIRYGILLTTITTCAVLGYCWPAPWSFIPIAWGFVIAFSVSRRWAWIEGDRELAMLNPTLSQAHIRVGFAQNLRDEALVVFLSMFLLVPLALRQAQLWAADNHIHLFDLTKPEDIHSLSLWIGFYGTELAKAVPFVDWAEVYHVEGDAPVVARVAMALHVVFAVRVLIDLVFLAALLQAISSASRDAQQKDLFYRKRAIRRLDPFTEPEAFRSLVKRGASGDWERNGERFDEFPPYDANRLVELSANRDERVRRAADFLLERDGVDHEPHHRLSMKAADREATPEAIHSILSEIENAGPHRNIYQLALARRRLLTRRSMAEIRRRIVRMITENHEPGDRVERTNALIEAMVGEHREAYAQARRVALDALAPDTGINLSIRSAVQQAASHDGAQAMRKAAADVLARFPETPD